MTPRATCLLLPTLLAVAVLATGCSLGLKKFTRPRYETLYIGMPQQEVKSVLGTPAEQDPTAWTYVNDMPFYTAVIHFEDGCVSRTQWSYEPIPATQPAAP